MMVTTNNQGEIMPKLTLEELLKTKVKDDFNEKKDVQFVPDFRVAVQNTTAEGVHFIIHPFGYDGDTLDFIVKGNVLKQL
jgi:hypothetical protein